MCVMGFTDTCPDPVPHIKTGPLQLNSNPTSQPDGCQRGPPGGYLLQRCIRMMFEQLLEKPYHLIRLAKNRRCATHHGECAGNIP